MLLLLVVDAVVIVALLVSAGIASSPWTYQAYVSWRWNQRMRKQTREKTSGWEYEQARTQEESYKELLASLAREALETPSPFGDLPSYDEDLGLIAITDEVFSDLDADILEDLFSVMGRDIREMHYAAIGPLDGKPSPHEIFSMVLDACWSEDRDAREIYLVTVKWVIVFATYAVAENLTRAQLLLYDPYGPEVVGSSKEHLLNDEEFKSMSEYHTAHVLLSMIREMWADFSSKA